jgi:hypothetical protein
MTIETEIRQVLQESFLGALVLTGTIEGAERAVTNAIAALDPDCSPEALLVEATRSALKHNTSSGESSSILPVEEKALHLSLLDLPGAVESIRCRRSVTGLDTN